MSDETPETTAAPRRNFLTALGAIIVGGLAGIAPVLAGVTTLLDPLRKRGGEEGMVLVTKLAILPDDGLPRKFTVTADKVDAWTTFQDTPVGAVYLTRSGSQISALNVVCPHAGCFVNIKPEATGFACPCHRSSFALDGEIDDAGSPSPRALDSLEVEVRNEDEVWVRFQNFQPGTHDKTPLV